MNRFLEIAQTNKPITVVGAGDSHMWGQGADGWMQALQPPFANGERRRLPRNIPTFLSLFEHWLLKKRNRGEETVVINSGFGCASTGRYLQEYWQDDVIRHDPDLVIIEFAINDWLEWNYSNVAIYQANLRTMIDEILNRNRDVIILTVSPIRGSQYNGTGYYKDYIEASRLVALSDRRILLADANRAMERFLSSENSGRNENVLFSDDWHVAQKGHELYCQCIIQALSEDSQQDRP